MAVLFIFTITDRGAKACLGLCFMVILAGCGSGEPVESSLHSFKRPIEAPEEIRDASDIWEDREQEAEVLAGSELITSSEAQFAKGESYLHGKDSAMDAKLAVKWFEQAALQGHIEALFQIGAIEAAGLLGEPNLLQAAAYYEQAAAKGHPEAQFHLGVAYAKGLGVPKNLDLARFWLDHSVENGHSEAGISALIPTEE